MEQVLTQNGSYPLNISANQNRNPGEHIFRDIIFDPIHPDYRFAIGPAGVFYITDRTYWDHLLLTSAMPKRLNNAFYYIYKSLYTYIVCGYKQLGRVLAVQGKISFLRINNVGTEYGPFRLFR